MFALANDQLTSSMMLQYDFPSHSSEEIEKWHCEKWDKIIQSELQMEKRKSAFVRFGWTTQFDFDPVNLFV